MLDTQKRSSTPGLSLPQILDRSFRIYRQNFVPFVVLSAVVQIPLLILDNVISAPQQDALLNMMGTSNRATLTMAEAQSVLGQVLGIAVVAIIVQLFLSYLMGIVIYGPVVYVASENHLGRSATLREGFSAVGKRLQPLAVGLALLYVILIVISIPLILPLALCGLGAGILLYVALVLGSPLVPILVLERTTVSSALARAWTLGKACVWKLLAVTAGVNVVTFVIRIVLGAVLLQALRNSTSPITDNVVAIIISLGSIVLLPLVPIAYTEIYYDVRTRIEGLDMALRSATTPNPTPADVASPVPSGTILANEDYLNLALFAVGAVVIIVLYAMFAASLGRQMMGF